MLTLKRIILGFLVLFFLFSLSRNFFEFQRNLGFYEEYKQEYEAAKQRNNQLQTELVKAKDPYMVEQTIRNELNMLKADEVAVLIPEPSPTPTVITPTPQPSYQQWWDRFFEQN